jgi:hypothetical protein
LHPYRIEKKKESWWRGSDSNLPAIEKQRSFAVQPGEVRVPLTAVVSKPDLEEEIKKLFSHGWLPEHGAVHLLGAIGW